MMPAIITNDESESPDKTKEAYTQRVDQILMACNMAQMNDDVKGWHKTLTLLYKEIYPELTPEEQHQAEVLENQMRKAVNNPVIQKQKDPKKNKKIFSTEPLFVFEIFLRTMLKERNWFAPKTDDITKANQRGIING